MSTANTLLSNSFLASIVKRDRDMALELSRTFETLSELLCCKSTRHGET
jgi:hypothetical protein